MLHLTVYIIDTLRLKAVKAALSITSGAYHTGLVSYFTQRDMFPSLMKVRLQSSRSLTQCLKRVVQYVQETPAGLQCPEPFVLIGLLVNYNKFELQNPYRLRLDDYVNEQTINTLVRCFGITCLSARDRYRAIQDDIPEAWNVRGTLRYLGLAVLGSRVQSATYPTGQDEAGRSFAKL